MRLRAENQQTVVDVAVWSKWSLCPLVKLYSESSGIVQIGIFRLQLPPNIRAGILQVSLLTNIIMELIF